MSDYASFKRGNKQYPLTTGTGRSSLRDADPFLFYALEFFKKVIETHVGARLLEAAVGAEVQAAVAMVVPYDPVPHLTSSHLKFPLLAVYRRDGKLETLTGGNRHDVSSFEVAYVLPPADAALAERLVPMLVAVRDVIDDRADLGLDPTYTPTGGTAGQTVWVDFAGAERVTMTEYEIGAVQGAERTPWADLLFYTLFMRGEVSERAAIADSTFETITGTGTSIDLKDPAQETVVTDFVQVETFPEPTLTVATPNTGTKAGGTLVTLTGTNFRVNTTPIVTFGARPATDVVVVNATTVQCRTPAHDAFPTFISDVELTAADGQIAELIAGYTFTTP